MTTEEVDTMPIQRLARMVGIHYAMEAMKWGGADQLRKGSGGLHKDSPLRKKGF